MKETITISCLLFCAKLVAQRPSTGTWMAVNIPVSFSDNWQMHNDAGYRTIGNSASAHQYLFRAGIRYFANKSFSTSAGVAFFNTRTSYSKYNHELEHEFRLWQEFNFQTRVTEKLLLQNRFRTEQRFFEATENHPSYFAHRYRYRAGATWSFSKKWSAELADEYMQQVKNGKHQFNQNRVLLSGTYCFNTSTALQSGYMWLLWPDASQHNITITFRKNISVHGNNN